MKRRVIPGLLKVIATYNAKNTLVAVYDFGDKTKACQFGVVQLDGRLHTID